MLRIGTIREGSTTVVRIDGDLEGEGIAELVRLVRQITGQISLELTDLTHANGAGLELIHRLETEGAELRGVSPYVELLLERARPPSPSTAEVGSGKTPVEDE